MSVVEKRRFLPIEFVFGIVEMDLARKIFDFKLENLFRFTSTKWKEEKEKKYNHQRLNAQNASFGASFGCKRLLKLRSLFTIPPQPPPSTTLLQPPPLTTPLNHPPSTTPSQPPPSTTLLQPPPSTTLLQPPPSTTLLQPPSLKVLAVQRASGDYSRDGILKDAEMTNQK